MSQIGDISNYVNQCNNYQVLKYLMTTNVKVDQYDRIVVSVSGGSDSDILIDMFTKCDPNKKVKYVFFDTGLEYQATKNHLNFLEDKYNIVIDRERPRKTIPVACREYGQPFISKYASEMISRLQRHNFTWVDEPYEELVKIYPNCKSALKWWCNDNGENSSFNIKRNKLLKEFMIKNPPTFSISNKCCHWAKKDIAKSYNKENDTDLNVTGVRKSEGGIRSVAYKNCFDSKDNSYDEYRPLIFFTDEDKAEYKETFGVVNSDCYEIWGMKRTGCCGCAFAIGFEDELELIQKYEPKLYKAVTTIFKDTYAYTREYRKFRKKIESQIAENKTKKIS